MAEETIYEGLRREGMSRRGFLKLCGALAGVMGLPYAPPVEASGLPAELARGPSPARVVAKALASKPRVPVVWMSKNCSWPVKRCAVSASRRARAWGVWLSRASVSPASTMTEPGLNRGVR